MNERLRIFLSYSHIDERLAAAIADALERRGFDVVTPLPEEPSANIQTHLDEAMRTSDAFALLLTPNSVGSPNVAFELGVAEASGRVVVPVFSSEEARRLAPDVLKSYTGLLAEGLGPDDIASHVADVLAGASPEVDADPEVLQAVELAASEADSWYDVGQRLRAIDQPDSAKQTFVSAFQYDFVEPSEEARRARWGAFAPMLELASGEVYPIPLQSVSSDWIAAWQLLLSRTSHPVIVSRVADLLWERKTSERPDEFARMAIKGYLEQSRGRWDSLIRAECLVRARELASRIGDEQLVESVVAATIRAARESIEASRHEPGVVLRLIESLLALRRDRQPPDIDALLAASADRFSDDPWIQQHILELRIERVSDASERSALQRAEVELWIEQVNRSEGLLRLTHLQKALELARNFGFADLANDLRKSLQSVEAEDLGLQTISATVTIPEEKTEALFEFFTGAGSWREALTRFGAYGPPVGSYGQNLETVRQLMADHPLQFLFTRVILDPEGRPIRNISSPEEQQEAVLIEHEVRTLGIWGVLAFEILKRIKAAYRLPEEGELAEFFETDLIRADVARNLGAAWRLHWDTDFTASAHLSVTATEAIIREMAVQAGLSVYREPQQGRPGSLKSLGELLFLLNERIDMSWWRYLRTLLVEPLGLNLRNRIAHGLVTKIAPQESAVLLHATAFLRLLQAGPQETGGTDPTTTRDREST